MKDHTCRQSRTCSCYLLGTEPVERCPVHGSGEWPPRCEICGKFLRSSEQRLQDDLVDGLNIRK